MTTPAMKLISLPCLALCLACPAAAKADELGQRLAALHDKHKKSIVAVEYNARIRLEGLPGINPSDNERSLRGTASGLVLGKGQLILVSTAELTQSAQAFEILGARARLRWTRLSVHLGGGLKASASVLATHERYGLALLRLDQKSKELQALTFPEQAPAPGVGARLAILSRGSRFLGSPLLARQARVAGVTEKLGKLRVIDPAMPGVHGGLVLALDSGDPIGVHAALPLASLPRTASNLSPRAYEPEQVADAARGYVIPIAAIRAWVAEAAAKKPVAKAKIEGPRRSWIGVEIQVITEELAETLGLEYLGGKVLKIYPDSPAAKAGIKVGDLISQVDEEDLELVEGETMRDIVGDLGVGEKVALLVRRGGENLTIDLELAASPPTPADAPRLPFLKLGFVLRGRTFFDQDLGGEGGLVVCEVKDSSQAKLAGLRLGDIITHINNQPVVDAEKARGLVQAGQSMLVKVLRKKKVIELRIQAS